MNVAAAAPAWERAAQADKAAPVDKVALAAKELARGPARRVPVVKVPVVKALAVLEQEDDRVRVDRERVARARPARLLGAALRAVPDRDDPMEHQAAIVDPREVVQLQPRQQAVRATKEADRSDLPRRLPKARARRAERQRLPPRARRTNLALPAQNHSRTFSSWFSPSEAAGGMVNRPAPSSAIRVVE